MRITCNGYKFFYNLHVHGVPFSEAAEGIFSTQAIAELDEAHSTDKEKRYKLISVSPSGRVLLIVFCKRLKNLETRIISARSASKKERRRYAEKFGNDVQFRAIAHDTPLIQVSYRLW